MMRLGSAVRIAVLIVLPFLAVYVVAPAIRANGGQQALFRAGGALVAFGILAMVAARVWRLRRPST